MKEFKRKVMEFSNVYDGDDLGCTYTKNKTLIKVWAPTASRVTCHLQNGQQKEQLNEQEQLVSMEKGDFGVWSLELIGDFELYSYVYHVYFGDEMQIATDPYAIASTANHERTVIVDMSKTKIDQLKECLSPLKSYTDSIIYEVHVRDFSIDPSSRMQHAGKFLAFTEEGTTTQAGLPSGIDYLKSLGITHVQLLPVYDFGSVDELNPESSYNWGYDPVQYNVPEGSYCTHIDDPYSRIIELKQCIQSLHKQGIRVIMDVVYNHMFDKNASAFEKIVPGYYFRQNEQGDVSNGSFCGNDLDSTRYMTQRFLLHSTRWWIDEYGFDGFRFDLMGILDIETMNLIAEQTLRINPSAMIYGEGWNMPTFLDDDKKATMMNHRKMPLIGHFSDIFREKIKGGTLEDKFHEGGYGAGDFTKTADALHLLRGTVLETLVEIDGTTQTLVPYFSQPVHSMNYVECHDNHTLWDKMQLSLPHESDEIRKKRQLFMIGLILFSQGVPFIHAGQEFLRTKQLDHNSYQSSDAINRIDWNRKDTYIDVVNKVMNFIRIRKEYCELRLQTEAEIFEYTNVAVHNQHVIEYILKPIEEGKFTKLHVLFNPNIIEITVELDLVTEGVDVILSPDGINAVAFESVYISPQALSSDKAKKQEVRLEPLGIYVLRE